MFGGSRGMEGRSLGMEGVCEKPTPRRPRAVCPTVGSDEGNMEIVLLSRERRPMVGRKRKKLGSKGVKPLRESAQKGDM